jgi:maltose/moltooligosaccharide transporter
MPARGAPGLADSAGSKPHLAPWRILEMNLGFLGLQFSFGLQQGNMTPIYGYLGADESRFPILLLAGPMTGLIVQPIVGALSDRTDTKWGRRVPYMIVGSMFCTLGLLFMPLSSSILMAASLLWMLDAGNNMTMEPYRAYVSDRLDDDQRRFGFLAQSAFTGLAQMLAFLTPSILVYAFGVDKDAVDSHNIPHTARIAFTIGALLSMATVLWSIARVPELPLTAAEKARIARQPKSAGAVLKEIAEAAVAMPRAMRRLAVMSLFQWYAMAAYWSYVIYSIGRSVYNVADPATDGFRSAVLANGEMAAFYNFIAFIVAIGLVPLARRFGPARVHACCLVLAGAGMLALPHVAMKEMLFMPAVGIGIGWASIMGNPYIILAGSIPPERTGVYMGIFNMMIVIPMLFLAATLPFYYKPLLGADPRNVLSLAGALLFLAALGVLGAGDEQAKSM